MRFRHQTSSFLPPPVRRSARGPSSSPVFLSFQLSQEGDKFVDALHALFLSNDQKTAPGLKSDHATPIRLGYAHGNFGSFGFLVRELLVCPFLFQKSEFFAESRSPSQQAHSLKCHHTLTP